MIAVAVVTLVCGTAGAIAVRSSLVDDEEADGCGELLDLQQVELKDADDGPLFGGDVDSDDRCDPADIVDSDALDDGVVEPDVAVDHAMDDYVHGDYFSARSIARRFEDSSDPLVRHQALRIDGASSCFLHDRGSAVAAWDQLDRALDKSFLRYVCNRNDIDVP